MGDSFQSIALPGTAAGNATVVAAQLSAWLIAKGIVEEGAIATPQGSTGFNPGPRAEDVLVSSDRGWQDIAFREIHIYSSRRVSTAVQGGLGPVSCPTCESALGDLDIVPDAFMRAVTEWLGGQEGALTCPACRTAAPISKWRTEPFWVFGDVTITFWNWPRIKESFLQEVEAAAGQPVNVVRGKI